MVYYVGSKLKQIINKFNIINLCVTTSYWGWGGIMKIQGCYKIDKEHYKINSDIDIYVIHVLIDNLTIQVSDMIKTITDNSWILKLSPVDNRSFEARAKRTVVKLVDEIFKKVANEVTADFGEYLISLSAQRALEDTFIHSKVPLAELFKEKVTGNPGFDFHTESHTTLIAFGEAKYSGDDSPYSNALTQICEFISLEKDVAELTDLSKFVSEKAVLNALDNNKAYIAAFSLNAVNPKRVFENILRSEYIKPILDYSELYLIGVEIDDNATN
jgi:hypothetical protein